MSEAITKQQKRGQPIRNVNIGDITMNYRQPPSAIVSILHRISGAGLFLMLPFLLYLLQLSLRSEDSFMQFKGVLEHPFVKIVVLVICWGYLHHFCAGIRHLFMDNHFALDKDGASITAKAVLILSLLLTVVVGLKLFGVF